MVQRTASQLGFLRGELVLQMRLSKRTERICGGLQQGVDPLTVIVREGFIKVLPDSNPTFGEVDNLRDWLTEICNDFGHFTSKALSLPGNIRGKGRKDADHRVAVINGFQDVRHILASCGLPVDFRNTHQCRVGSVQVVLLSVGEPEGSQEIPGLSTSIDGNLQLRFKEGLILLLHEHSASNHGHNDVLFLPAQWHLDLLRGIILEVRVEPSLQGDDFVSVDPDTLTKAVRGVFHGRLDGFAHDVFPAVIGHAAGLLRKPFELVAPRPCSFVRGADACSLPANFGRRFSH